MLDIFFVGIVTNFTCFVTSHLIHQNDKNVMHIFSFGDKISLFSLYIPYFRPPFIIFNHQNI